MSHGNVSNKEKASFTTHLLMGAIGAESNTQVEPHFYSGNYYHAVISDVEFFAPITVVSISADSPSPVDSWVNCPHV